jgi:hypothetical protein
MNAPGALRFAWLLAIAACVSCRPTNQIESPLTGKVWSRTGRTGLPGEMLIFLKDGTLLMDSCWETHRLAIWKQIGETRLIFVEDGAETPVEVLKITADELRILLKVPQGEAEKHYRYQRAPFLCPDMKR